MRTSNWRRLGRRGTAGASSKPRRRPRALLRVELLEDRVTPTISLLSSFLGMNAAEGGFFDPPDTEGAAGPTHIGEVVNSAVAFYDKTDGSRDIYETFLNFFQNERFSGFLFDPVITYDDISGRFVVACLDVDFTAERSFIDIAFSNDSNPLNGFIEKQRIEVTELNLAQNDDVWGDYPKIGFNREAIVITINMFGFQTPFSHTSVISINKISAYDQNTSTFQRFDVNRGGFFTMAAAKMHGATINGPMWFAEATFNGGSDIRLTKMTNVLNANPTFQDFTVSVPTYGVVPGPRDPGGTVTTRIDARMLSAAWRGNTLVVAHTIGFAGGAKARWYQLDTAPATPTLVMSGTINPAGNIDTYYPSVEIATDGTIGLNYIQSGTGAGMFMSMMVTGRAPYDAAGTMQTAVLVKGGTDVYAGSRAGDYSGISVDPVDGRSFWAANEWATNAASPNWGTWLGHFKVLAFGDVGNRVFDDFNRNGIQDAGEGGVLGLEVRLFRSDNLFIGLQITLAAGNYQFLNIAPGNYYVQYTAPVGFGFSQKDQGSDDNLDSDADPLTGRTDVFAVVAGVTDNSRDAGLVLNLPPENVDPGGPYSIFEGNALTLTGSATDPDGDPITFSWDINGDGLFTDAFGANPTIPWAQLQTLAPPINDGTLGGVIFNVRLRSDDGRSAPTDSSPTTLTVFNTAPTANLGNGGPAPEGGTTTVAFAAQFDPSAADNAAGLRYSYDFNDDGVYEVGDGATYGGSVAAASVTVPSTFFPDGGGTRTVRARLFDKDGGFAQYTTNITITNVNPTAVLGNNGPVPEASASATISFASFVDPSAADVAAGFRFSYDFNNDGVYEVGDGATYAGSVTSTSQTVSGSFLADGPGTRRVRARIFDKDGGFTQYTTDILISNVPPTAVLGNSGAAAEGSAGSTVTFASQSDVSTADTLAGFRYSYDFNDDGVFEQGNGTYGGSVTNATAVVPASFLLDGPGVVRIRARILDKDGGFTDYTTDIPLTNVDPVASPPASNTNGKEGTNSFFNLGSFTDPGRDNPWQVTVDWGDGQTQIFNATAAGVIPGRTHAYVDNGAYTVQVTVDDGDGGASSISFEVTVDNLAPILSPPGDQTSMERTLHSFDLGSFFDFGVLDADWSVRVNWGDSTAEDTFSTSSSGDLGNLTHRFARDGAYVVQVFVKDNASAQGVGQFSVFVENIDRVIVGTDAGGPALVRIFNSVTNELESSFDPFPDLPGYTGGVRVASGDVNGDGFVDYILGTGPGTQTKVRVIDGQTQNVLDSFDPFGTSFAGKNQGVYVATGDVNSDGRLDIIVGAGGLSRTVKVFKYAAGPFFNPLSRTQFDSFDPFPGTAKVDGVTVAVADIDGDGREDIICGTGPGSTAKVVVFRYSTPGASSPRVKIADIRPFETTFRRGVFVAAADLNGNGKAEIIVGPGTTSGRVTQDGPNGGRNIVPRVRVFTSLGTTWFFTQFQPLPSNYDTGVRVGVLPDGGFGRILTASGHSVPGKASKFDGRTLQLIDDVFSDASNRGFWIVGSR